MINRMFRWLVYPVTTPLERSYLIESLTHRCVVIRTTVTFLAIVIILLFAVLEAPVTALLVWVLPFFVFQLVRYKLGLRVLKIVETGSDQDLQSCDFKLRMNSIVNQLLVGSGIWTVGINSSSQTAIFVTLVICLFGIGAMTNLARDFLSFTVSVPPLMLQPIAFWMSQGQSGVSIWAPMLVITLLMFVTARQNEISFRESIKIRYENSEILKALQEERQSTLNALANAEHANTARSFILAAASHDLRQPLYAALIIHDTMAAMPESLALAEMMSKQRKTLETLNALFNDLLDMARFEGNKVALTHSQFPLHQLIRDLFDQYKLQCVQKGIKIKQLSSPVWLYTDRQLLLRLLSNLLSNAIHYTTEGHILISCKVGNAVTIRIKDTGCGIEPEYQSIIFGEFTRAPQSQENGHGVGLGLAIVKRISNLLGFNLRLQSQVGEGTQFDIEIPSHIVTHSPPVEDQARLP